MKLAQEIYSMENFLNEVFEDKIKLIDRNASPNTFEQASQLSDDDRRGPHEHLINTGTEEIEAMVVGKGIISCPAAFVQEHSIKELEDTLDSVLKRYTEIYMEGGEEGTVWEGIASLLSDVYEITDESLEDSGCNVEILLLEPISEYESEITIEVSGYANWYGEMHEPDPPEDY